MPQTSTMDVTFPSDREIFIIRTVNAPRHLVYRAWTTPELVRKWWAGRRAGSGMEGGVREQFELLEELAQNSK
jgi:uncharacterized protein YndB with AHSA1/START domain